MIQAESAGRGLSTIALIFLVCLIPFLTSYVVYYLWPPQSRMNYGTLVEPRPLPAGSLARPDGSPFLFSDLKGRWVMLQIDSSACSQACRRKLYQMRQVRLTQGKDLGRIERVWLIPDHGPLDPALLRDYEGTHIARADAAVIFGIPAEGDPADHVYLIDPLGSLMLRFPKDADPSRMKKDLERMLKLSWRSSQKS